MTNCVSYATKAAEKVQLHDALPERESRKESANRHVPLVEIHRQGTKSLPVPAHEDRNEGSGVHVQLEHIDRVNNVKGDVCCSLV